MAVACKRHIWPAHQTELNQVNKSIICAHVSTQLIIRIEDNLRIFWQGFDPSEYPFQGTRVRLYRRERVYSVELPQKLQGHFVTVTTSFTRCATASFSYPCLSRATICRTWKSVRVSCWQTLVSGVRPHLPMFRLPSHCCCVVYLGLCVVCVGRREGMWCWCHLCFCRRQTLKKPILWKEVWSFRFFTSTQIPRWIPAQSGAGIAWISQERIPERSPNHVN